MAGAPVSIRIRATTALGVLLCLVVTSNAALAATPARVVDKKNGFSFELPPGWKNLTHAQLVEKFDRIAQDDPQDAKAINAVPTGISDFAQTTLDGPGFEPNVFVTVTEKTVTIGATISAAKSYYSAAFSSEQIPTRAGRALVMSGGHPLAPGSFDYATIYQFTATRVLGSWCRATVSRPPGTKRPS